MRRSFNGGISTITRINSMSATLPVGTTCFRLNCQVLIVLALLFGALVSNSPAAPKFVSGLAPDWNQPYRYASPNGPGPDPNRPNPPNIFAPTDQWNAWCAPTAAANLAGHWTDVRGVPVADATAYPNSTVAWAAGPSWQDYLADSNRPPMQVAAGPLPSPTTDIGWYLDTNRGVPYDDLTTNATMGGYFFSPADGQHPGTLLRNLHVGLQNFLNDRYSLSHGIYWRTGTRGRPGGYAGGVDPTGGVAVVHANEVSAFNEVKSEIDSNRTLIVSFSHWSIAQMAAGAPQSGTLTNEAAYGYTNYFFNTYTGAPNDEGEYWNLDTSGEGLGHAVTCVGYIVHGDPADPWRLTTPTDWVIVHDNWASTPRNVAVPFGTPGGFNQYWVANTTAVPWGSAAKVVNCSVPDWNQPYTYGPPPTGPSDPAAGAPNQWNAWCAPSSAANLAGHWADCYGAPVADADGFPNSTVPWAAGTFWHDYQADGWQRPPVQNPPCALAWQTDIGWYMDTNRGQPLDLTPGLMGGYCLNPAADIHVGTYLKDIHVGLGLYLNALFGQPNGPGWDTGTRGKVWAAGIDALGQPAQPHFAQASAFGEVKQEINRNHTLILCFSHWAIQPTAFSIAASGTNTEWEFGGTYYTWPSQPPNTGDTNAEDEVWNLNDYYDVTNNLGHAVTCVGYIPANDGLDSGPALGIGPTDWVIVHDNWASTPRNVIIPFDWVNWRANTTAEPSQHLPITNIQAVTTNIVIRFRGIPSAQHYLEWKSEMTNDTWSIAVSNMPFVVGTMQVTNTVESSVKQRFYRIRAAY